MILPEQLRSACEEGAVWFEKQPDIKTAWEKCERSDWMMWALGRLHYNDGKTLRLLACKFACDTPIGGGQVVYELLTDDRSKKAIEVAILYAHGRATERELQGAAYAAAYAYADARAAARAADAATWVAYAAAWAAADVAAWAAADVVARAAYAAAYADADADAWSAARAAADVVARAAYAAADAAKKAQAQFIREFIPFNSVLELLNDTAEII